jgi:hypothetical protein
MIVKVLKKVEVEKKKKRKRIDDKETSAAENKIRASAIHNTKEKYTMQQSKPVVKSGIEDKQGISNGEFISAK